jgi:hypothetical protein
MRWNSRTIFLLLLCFLLPEAAHAGNVLYLGDSHSVNTALEKSIYQSFFKRGDSFVSEAVCSSKPDDWVDSPKPGFPCCFSRRDGKEPASGKGRCAVPQISEIVTELKPARFDIVVIQQGDNMLGYNRKDIGRLSLKLLSTLMEKIGNRQVHLYWIGPTWPSSRLPAHSNNDYPKIKTIKNTEKVRAGINDAIKLLRAKYDTKCQYLDGMELLDQNSAEEQPWDGLHFAPDSQAYSQLARKAFEAIEISLKKNTARVGPQ